MDEERSATAAAVSLPAAGLGDREERCRNESRSRIVVVVHPIMRLARHFRSRAANNPFSTWEALIIVWRDERNGRRRKGGKRQGYREQIRGRGRGRQPFGRGRDDRWCRFIFFGSWLRSLEIIYRSTCSEAALIRSIRGNDHEMSSESLSSPDRGEALLLDSSVHHKSPRPQIESRNRFQTVVHKPSRALKYIYICCNSLRYQQRCFIDNTPYRIACMCITRY